jgi:hypothetical protein
LRSGLLSQKAVESIPPFPYVRSAMTRARQELVPNIPWEVDDVEIEGTWAETWSGDYFLLHQDNDSCLTF